MNNNIMRNHFRQRYKSVEYVMSETPPLPKSLNIELNNTCNHKCIFCDAHSEYLKNPLNPCVMDYDFAISIIKNASDLGIGSKEIGLYMNGEPFVYPRLAEVVGYAKKLGTFPYLYLTTNGAIKDFEKMTAVIDAGVDSIRFSVNAGTRTEYEHIHGKDDFDLVIENIKRLDDYRKRKALKLAISVSSVITPQTISNKKELPALLGNYVDDIMFFNVIQSDRFGKEDFFFQEEDVEYDQEYKCRSIFESMFIDASGNVLLCCTSETYFNIDTIVTTLSKEEIALDKVWNMERYKYFRRMFMRGESLKGTICEKCILRKRRGLVFDS